MTKTSFPLQKHISRLEEIERYFQQAEVDIEEAMKLHEEALGLAKEIREYLDQAEQKLSTIDIAALRREA